jgi:Uma2 family endonuclease
MATIVLEDRMEIEIPADLRSLADFRRWALSDRFPERGRIDYIAGRIEVDMSPEDFFCHGTLKTAIAFGLYGQVEARDLGHLVSDRTRISSPAADVSAEPDIVLVSHAALESGRVRLIPKAGGEAGRYIEVEGSPDLIVEIVSDSSVIKDTQRLRDAYFRAGVGEYWLADARREPVSFEIQLRGETGFEPAPPDREGFQRSGVFAGAFRLDARRDARGHWRFKLQYQP